MEGVEAGGGAGGVRGDQAESSVGEQLLEDEEEGHEGAGPGRGGQEAQGPRDRPASPQVRVGRCGCGCGGRMWLAGPVRRVCLPPCPALARQAGGTAGGGEQAGGAAATAQEEGGARVGEEEEEGDEDVVVLGEVPRDAAAAGSGRPRGGAAGGGPRAGRGAAAGGGGQGAEADASEGVEDIGLVSTRSPAGPRPPQQPGTAAHGQVAARAAGGAERRAEGGAAGPAGRPAAAPNPHPLPEQRRAANGAAAGAAAAGPGPEGPPSPSAGVPSPSSARPAGQPGRRMHTGRFWSPEEVRSGTISQDAAQRPAALLAPALHACARRAA
jgi:hypothetical protein